MPPPLFARALLRCRTDYHVGYAEVGRLVFASLPLLRRRSPNNPKWESLDNLMARSDARGIVAWLVRNAGGVMAWVPRERRYATFMKGVERGIRNRANDEIAESVLASRAAGSLNSSGR